MVNDDGSDHILDDGGDLVNPKHPSKSIKKLHLLTPRCDHISEALGVNSNIVTV